MSGHSVFSPSASYRILNCPPSLRLCAGSPDETSYYAEEGTEAHTLCAYLVEKAFGGHMRDPTPGLRYYNEEMRNCAEGYAAFVQEEYEKAKQTCVDTLVLVEQWVDLSGWVPGCGGTADCVILTDGTMEVIDFKYGVGVPVSAQSAEFGGNTQLMCYCLGVLDKYDGIYDVDYVKMVIYQPRRSHISEYTMSREDLLRWADEVLAPTAMLALDGEGTFKAGEHCRFCKVKATCRKRAEYNQEIAKYDFESPALLEDYEIDDILLMADRLTEWVKDVKEYALTSALSGTEYEHFKVVEGRSNRRYTSDEEVAKAVAAAGYDPYDLKLKGVTAMTAMLGRQKFEEFLGSLTFKPQGKPALVLKSDRRPAMQNTAQEDFKQ